MTTMTRLRTYQGLPILSYGFRPFFLLAALHAALVMLAWLPIFYGELALHSAFSPVDWHAHEMLYGFLPAVITGFLLTAIPNWTGRLPIQGAPLLALLLVWIAGRIAVTCSGNIGAIPAALIDIAFLVLVAAAAAREVLAGKTWGNLKIVALLALLIIGNITFHVESYLSGHAAYGARIGVAAAVLLIMVMGGRIIPSFTTNWLKRNNPGRLAAPFGSYDRAVLALSGIALLVWLIAPFGTVTAVALALAGIANIARLCRWAGDRTTGERLLLILHVAYAFIPLGFLLMAAASSERLPASAAIHAWTAGGIGVMTLAVMTRVSLGHTGRALTASHATQFIYALIIIAALARITAALVGADSDVLLQLAAFAWIAAFAGFVIVYSGILVTKRRQAA